MELSGGRGKFIDFFLGADRKTHRVTFETYEKLPQVEPPHRFPDFKPKWTGETLLASIAKLFRGQLNLDAADPTSIERTTQAGYGVYVCIAIHLRMLHRGLIAITPYVKASPNLRIADPEKKETVKNALDDIDKAQAFLHWALSHSRAFWRTILTMGTHFQDQVVSVLTGHLHRQLIVSSVTQTRTEPPPQALRCSAPVVNKQRLMNRPSRLL